MPTTRERPPDRVCAAFGIDAGELAPVGHETAADAWRADGMVLRPVTDSAEVIWAGQVLGTVQLPDLHIARPARARDGRQVVGGWMAYRIDEDVTTARWSPDDAVLASVKLHQSLAGLPRPEFIDRRDDVLARADRMAWGEQQLALDESRGGRWFEILAGSVKPVNLPEQVVHGNLYSCLRVGADETPVVVDFRPFFRPAEWASALVVVDAIAFDGAGAELTERWSHLPAWRQMLLRAMLFRLAVPGLSPEVDDDALEGLRRAAGIISQY